MKRMLFLLFATVCLLASCNQIDPVVEDEGECQVSLDFVGEITTSESPITKVSSNDIYFVQVYKESSAFAMGYFDDISKMYFYLKKGNNYRIVVSLLRNGKTLLSDAFSSTTNALHADHYSPNIDTYYHASSWYQPLNYCYYNSVAIYKYYEEKTSTTLYSRSNSNYKLNNITRAGACGATYPMCDDWFYGEINDYSPTGEYEIVSLDLKRVGFKLKYELTGVTDGEVTVKVYNSDKTFIDNTTNTSTYSSDPHFFAFYEARNAWLYADDYMENMTLAVSWKRGIGVTEDYGTKTIQIKRNCLNNIKINLGSNDQSAGMNLTVEAESTIGAEAVTIPVQ